MEQPTLALEFPDSYSCTEVTWSSPRWKQEKAPESLQALGNHAMGSSPGCDQSAVSTSEASSQVVGKL